MNETNEQDRFKPKDSDNDGVNTDDISSAQQDLKDKQDKADAEARAHKRKKINVKKKKRRNVKRKKRINVKEEASIHSHNLNKLF